MKNLVIVESPTKARTLGQFLGDKYSVLASMGHVRDLPKSEFGVDVSKNFEPRYVIPKAKQKQVNILKKEMIDAKKLILATDPDREGEAIAWHLWELVKNEVKLVPKRVVFHEITEEAVKEAFDSPFEIDMRLVDAQQARRVLDRLVGYRISPILWQKIKRGLSAGRVQSVALRLICDREREIEKFKSEEYWTIEAELEAKKGKLSAKLLKKATKNLKLKTKKEVDEVLGELKGVEYRVTDIVKKEAKSYPPPPFTTSTMQQAAATNLGYTAKRTMVLAQDLYENGLISYMRTDSVNLATSAVTQIRKLIEEKFGKNYLPEKPKAYKVKSKVAQEAHEAIRPTHVQVTSDKLQVTGDTARLYDLIWRRAVACQMKEAVYDQTTVDITAGDFLFSARGSIVKFDGWLKAHGQAANGEEQRLPELTVSELLKLLKLIDEQHFTEPPARYTDATLVKALEQHEIGRPSTYAPIISTIIERNYVIRQERKFFPTDLGMTVCEFLVKNFPDVMDISFTAEMEEELDQIARGEREWRPTMADFYKPFSAEVDKVEREAAKVKLKIEVTDEKCELCGKPMVIREGRYGKFLACSGFPECRNTKPLESKEVQKKEEELEKSGIKCPKCSSEIVIRKTRRGRVFYGCSSYPKCNWASWEDPSKVGIGPAKNQSPSAAKTDSANQGVKESEKLEEPVKES